MYTILKLQLSKWGVYHIYMPYTKLSRLVSNTYSKIHFYIPKNSVSENVYVHIHNIYRYINLKLMK